MSVARPGARDLLARAVGRALAGGRWEVADLIARRSRELAPDLLEGRAAELALSPLAADQILCLVLDRGADDVREGRTPLVEAVFLDGPGPDDATRLGFQRLGREAEAAAFVRDLELVRDLEARHDLAGLRGGELAEHLAEDAALQDLLWDDPRIPADLEVRRLMRASVPLILRRAHELEARGRTTRMVEAPAEPRTLDVEDLRLPPLLLGSADLGRLLDLAFAALLTEPRAAAPLLKELDRATVVPDHALPPHVVRLGSWVEYSDGLAGRTEHARLVGARRDGDPCAVSVLNPTGSALIGLSAGQSILWKDHLGFERLVTVRRVGSADDGRCARGK